MNMLCPNCNREMHTDRVHADWACECGLAGPPDVLEKLAADKAALAEAHAEITNFREAVRLNLEALDMAVDPLHVLAEAERLLRAGKVYTITLRVCRDLDGGGVTLRGQDLRKVRSKGSLAGAFYRLTRGRDG